MTNLTHFPRGLRKGSLYIRSLLYAPLPAHSPAIRCHETHILYSYLDRNHLRPEGIYIYIYLFIYLFIYY